MADGGAGDEEVEAEQFGPYTLVRLLGQGGMGEVFEAYDIEQERTVALKRLAPQVADDAEFQKRFRRECRLASRLRSPHVIPIHRSGEIDGRLFIDMRLVEGRDLAAALEQEVTLSPERAVRIVGHVASALDAAHRDGLVHRDVKPSNVLLDTTSEADEEFAYLADFGVTRTIGDESRSLTGTHGVVGSLDYMAPEQFDGEVGPSIDIYSLGCLLFHCLTGDRPYPVEGFPQLMKAHLSRPVPRPSDAHPALGRRFDDVVAQAMAKDPAERLPSAGALAAAAREALGTGAPATPAPPMTRETPAAPAVETRSETGSRTGSQTGVGFRRAARAEASVETPVETSGSGIEDRVEARIEDDVPETSEMRLSGRRTPPPPRNTPHRGDDDAPTGPIPLRTGPPSLAGPPSLGGPPSLSGPSRTRTLLVAAGVVVLLVLLAVGALLTRLAGWW